MKLWMVITIFGLNGAVIGPLPYDKEECLFRASVREANIQQNYNPINPPKYKGKIVLPDDIKYLCVFRDKRPQLETD